jgi:hypothetical protein
MTNKDLVDSIQKEWATLILEIGKANRKNENLEDLMNKLIHELYAFDHCDVLFKPTLAKEKQFRSTKDEFISYFLGQNNVCSEDTGFAIKNWQSIKFENYRITEFNDYLISMGNYFFEDINNTLLKVEYTFGFINIDNKLKINLHHSSLPYSG